MPHLVAFFGPDGSGKTTQAAMLADYFQAHGTRVRKVWVRSPHTLAFVVSRFFLRIGFCRTVSSSRGRQIRLPAVHRSPGLRRLWSFLELVSVMPVILFRVYIPIFLGYTLVAERYVVDTIVTIAYYIDDPGFIQGSAAKFLLCFVPTDTEFIYLDSTYSTIMSRRGHITEPYDFIEFQKRAYRTIGKIVGAKVIDTSYSSAKETSARIIRWLRADNPNRMA